VIVFRPDVFAAGAASRIIAELATAHQHSREHAVSLMLAGGSTPRGVYSEIARVPGLPWQDVAIWFGDERAVPPEHPDSNYRMAMDTLLAHVPVLPGSVHRMEAERDDLDNAARAYERTLPVSIDILLLGIGRDGHTASIFPDAAPRDVADRDVVAVHSTAHPHARLTITPRVIRHAATSIVLGAGRDKADAVARALDERTDPRECPASFARAGLWLLDDDAAASIDRAHASSNSNVELPKTSHAEGA
jgi:6-phosphogluconolactonase